MTRTRRWTLTALALLLMGACGSEKSAESGAPAGKDATAAMDVAVDTASGLDASAGDSGVVPDTAATDAAPAFDCKGACGVFDVCEAYLPVATCTALCEDGKSAAQAQKCVTTTADCDSFVACMVGLIQPKPPALRKFDDGFPGFGFRTRAGDFTVQTTTGPFTFSEHYDGNSSYLFFFVGAGIYKMSDGGDYLKAIWYDATAGDLAALMKLSPPSAHYFFIGYRDANGQDNSAAHVGDMAKRFEAAMKGMSPLESAAWKQRLHFVTQPAPFGMQPPGKDGTIGGWLGEYTSKKTPANLAIDRFQKIRQVGLLRLVGPPKFFLQHAAYEAVYFDYEFQREIDHPTDEKVKLVTVYDMEATAGGVVDVQLPDEAEMAGYDTVEIDLAHYCKEHDQTNCFEWDYHAWLKVIERPADAQDAVLEKPCQVKIAEKKAAAEVMGACPLPAGATQAMACKTDADCSDQGTPGKCAGYKAEVLAVSPVEADTLPCTCITPRQAQVERVKTCVQTVKPVAEKPGQCKGDPKKTCKADAQCGGDGPCEGYVAPVEAVTGYGKCGCQDVSDIQRWITSYHREGRWINDSERALYYFGKGGKVRLRYKGSYPYTVVLRFRLMNKGKNKGRPFGMTHLFAGGPFNLNYNKKYEPLAVKVPAEAKRVEVGVDVSGHGFGDKANCAEFCNHTHHFTVGGKEHVRNHPWPGDQYGCAKQVIDGVVPNQFGTWTLGRGGWCPGFDIEPTVWDVTAQVQAGQEASISYKGLFQGKDYDPQPGSGGGFGARIDMDSWVMYWK